MKRYVPVLLAALSGFAASQIYGSDTLDRFRLARADVSTSVAEADDILQKFTFQPYGGRSPGDVAQNASEATVALMYLQVKQNQEIIRLLNAIKNQ